MTESIFKKIGSVISTELDNTKTSLQINIGNKQDTLISGVNIKTINGLSLLGGEDLIIKGGSDYSQSIITDLLRSFYNIGSTLSTVNYNVGNCNTQTYGWLVQRTDGVAAGVAQFGLISGSYNSSGQLCMICIPFQINVSNIVTIGTVSTLWTNTTSNTSDLSTTKMSSDDKSGRFVYFGNIPFPGYTSHKQGIGYGVLKANNTAIGIGYNTSAYYDIQYDNGYNKTIPYTTAENSGWKGIISGYSQSDSKQRIVKIDWTGSETSAPNLNIDNPNSSTGTSPLGNIITSLNSSLLTSVISGVTHCYNSSSQAFARVYHQNASTYQDYQSSTGWGYYSSSAFPIFILEDGRAVVFHNNGNIWMYSAYNSRVQLNTFLPITLDGSWCGGATIAVGINTWAIMSTTETIPSITFVRFNTATNKFVWGGTYSSGFINSGSYNFLRLLPNNRVLIGNRSSQGNVTLGVGILTLPTNEDYNNTNEIVFS